MMFNVCLEAGCVLIKVAILMFVPPFLQHTSNSTYSYCAHLLSKGAICGAIDVTCLTAFALQL